MDNTEDNKHVFDIWSETEQRWYNEISVLSYTIKIDILVLSYNIKIEQADFANEVCLVTWRNSGSRNSTTAVSREAETEDEQAKGDAFKWISSFAGNFTNLRNCANPNIQR